MAAPKGSRPPIPAPATARATETGSPRAKAAPADHGEETYRGSGRLQDRNALITGGDSGIGAAVAVAREGDDVAIVYLPLGAAR